MARFIPKQPVYTMNIIYIYIKRKNHKPPQCFETNFFISVLKENFEELLRKSTADCFIFVFNR